MFKCIGVYRIIPTMASVIKAAQFHKCLWLLDNNGRYIDELHWDDYRDLSLIEIQILGNLPTGLLRTISQGDQTSTDQAPYMEYYLDPTGTKLLSEQEAVNTDNRHICFFLHFTDVNKPLSIGNYMMMLPSISDLPERLQSFTHYLPVD